MPPALIIRSSAIHAAGCYTLDSIRKGTRVCEYDGPRVSKDIADERYADRMVTYLFGIGETGQVIDGFGMPMFINHCCDPNCETEEDNGRIFIKAIKNIPAGAELTYEYNLYDSDEEEQPCFCSAPKCRKTMFSELELKRRKKITQTNGKGNGKTSTATA